MSGWLWVVVLVSALADAGEETVPDPPAVEAPTTDSPTTDRPTTGADPAEATGQETPAHGPRKPNLGRRTWRELCAEPAFAEDPACRAVPRVGAVVERPSLFEPRSSLATATLGALVGFGTGFYYAGDHLQGTIFVIADALVWIGLTTAVVALNQLVIRNDFRTGVSLSRGERPFGQWEKNYYALSWAGALILAASHLYQGIAGIFAARATNRTLESFSVVPLAGGGSIQLGVRW